MSAMNDIQTHLPSESKPSGDFRAARDVLLAIGLVILIALGFQVLDRSVRVESAPASAAAPVVQDWKGNSGSVPVAR